MPRIRSVPPWNRPEDDREPSNTSRRPRPRNPPNELRRRISNTPTPPMKRSRNDRDSDYDYERPPKRVERNVFKGASTMNNSTSWSDPTEFARSNDFKGASLARRDLPRRSISPEHSARARRGSNDERPAGNKRRGGRGRHFRGASTVDNDLIASKQSNNLIASKESSNSNVTKDVNEMDVSKGANESVDVSMNDEKEPETLENDDSEARTLNLSIDKPESRSVNQSSVLNIGSVERTEETDESKASPKALSKTPDTSSIKETETLNAPKNDAKSDEINVPKNIENSSEIDRSVDSEMTETTVSNTSNASEAPTITISVESGVTSESTNGNTVSEVGIVEVHTVDPVKPADVPSTESNKPANVEPTESIKTANVASSSSTKPAHVQTAPSNKPANVGTSKKSTKKTNKETTGMENTIAVTNTPASSFMQADFISLDESFPIEDKSIEESFKQFEDDLIEEYRPKKARNSSQKNDSKSKVEKQFPWMRPFRETDRRNLSVSDQLTAEIKNFAAYVSPSRAEIKHRQEVVNNVRAALKRRWPNKKLNVHVFGSFATNLYLPESDIDLIINSEGAPFFTSRSSLYQLSSYLRSEGIAEGAVVIAKARVPIIKFRDTKYNIAVDISFEQLHGLGAVNVINNWTRQYPAMRPLALVIKQFLMKRGLNNVHTGGLGGYSLLCMLETFLTTHPRIASGSIIPERNLGVLLIEFFELFGMNFNYADLIIRPTSTRRLAKKSSFKELSNDGKPSSALKLVIQDPNNEENNISRASFNIRGVKKAFAGAFNLLTGKCYELDRSKQNPNETSILGCIINASDQKRQFHHDNYPIEKKEIEEPELITDSAIREKADDLLRSIYVLHEDSDEKAGEEYAREKIEKNQVKEKRQIQKKQVEKIEETSTDTDENEDSKVDQISVDKAKRRYYWLSKAIVI